jgi:hypothetical protein
VAFAQPGKARKGSQRSKLVAAKQVAAAAPAWANQTVQPQHAEAELLQGEEAAVPIANQVADLETILQERDACGVSAGPRGSDLRVQSC